MAKTKTAVTKAPKGAVVSYEEQIKREVAEMQERVNAPAGVSVRLTKAKTFAMPDKTTQPGPMRAVVVDFIGKNMFYDRPYKEGVIVTPACWAAHKFIKQMAPPNTVPAKQGEACATCKQNEWGSAGDGSNRKGCKNGIQLALMQADATEDSPIFTLMVPPTSLGAWSAYVDTLAKAQGTIPRAVVTEIAFDPGSDYQKLTFKAAGPNKGIGVHMAKLGEATAILGQLPDPSGYEAPARGKAKR